MQAPLNRAQAREKGLARYFTGLLCKSGHVAERRVTNGACLECERLSSERQRRENPESRRAIKQRWAAANPGKLNLWAKQNPEAHRASASRWAKANPGKAAAQTMLRKVRIAKRTPPWADLSAIRAFYANCPAGYHVDHIIPLRGRLVSGLHVLENLQYLPAAVNLRKGATFDPSTHAH